MKYKSEYSDHEHFYKAMFGKSNVHVFDGIAGFVEHFKLANRIERDYKELEEYGDAPYSWNAG